MNEKLFNVEIEGTATVAVQERLENFAAGGGGASASIELGKEWETRNERRRHKARQRALARCLILAVALLVLVAAVVAWALIPETGGTAAPSVIPAPLPAEQVEDMDTVAIIDPDVGLLGPGPSSAETYTADAKMITDAMAEILLTQGYLSDAVPLPYEYQDYMRWFSAVYGCPYPVALAAADWETQGTFDMNAVGAVGEVGIFQLNPGPGGTYHADLEENTGLDPNTPMGNIAGGCYLLGKYMDAYGGDVDKVAMAYNMGPSGAARAWEAGITSTEYSRGFKETVEKWESLVNAWRGI